VPETSVDTRFAFQPLINLHTGGVIAMEMLARPVHRDVRSLLRSAAHAGELEKLDVTLAVAAARCSSEHETLLPLHLNLMADTVVAEGETLAPLHHALSDTGQQASQTVLEINPSDAALQPELLFAGLHRLRRLGYRIALDGVGVGNYPLTVIAEARPDLIKMDREIVAGLPGESSCVAILEALQHLATRIGAQVVAEGLECSEQLATLRQYGVGIAQGNLLGPPNRRPQTYLPISGIAELRAPVSPAPTRGQPKARITDFMHPAVTLPISATGEEVRAVLSDRPAISGVVLVDDDGRPRCTLDRNRFLLAVSGAYGYALYAQREAARLGDEPRVLESSSSALAALELVRSTVAHRRYDDIVVLDSSGRCTGVVCVGDVIQGVAQMNIEQAAALHPLTRLPGSDVAAQLVDRKVADGDTFAVSWLDVDDFGAVNDRSGFAAGDDLIRELGRALTDAAKAIPSVALAHIGGNDFVVISDLDDVVPFGSAVLDEPWEVDGHEVTLSLASLICLPGTVAGHQDVSRMLARLHRHAKSMPTTSWVSGRPGSDRVDVLRGDVRVVSPVGYETADETAYETSA
jgi:EAL domain-containing protein (putative c-di-GMP-specific phosphodiesterase class I)/GGDEF domain-containing protein